MLIVQMLVTLCVRVMDVMFSTFTMQQKRNVLNAATTAMYVLVQQPQSAFDVVSATQMTAFHLLQQQSGRHGTWRVVLANWSRRLDPTQPRRSGGSPEGALDIELPGHSGGGGVDVSVASWALVLRSLR